MKRIVFAICLTVGVSAASAFAEMTTGQGHDMTTSQQGHSMMSGHMMNH